MDSDKIKGMLWGVTVGDALGYPYEFKRVTPKSIYDGYIPNVEHTISFQYGRTKTIEIGSVSDDTEMTIALFNTLKSNNMKYDKDKVILSYMEWANSKPPGIGKNTGDLLKGVKTLKGYENRLEKKERSIFFYAK